MIFALATLALVSLPFILDLYFSTLRDADSAEEEYIPDGR